MRPGAWPIGNSIRCHCDSTSAPHRVRQSAGRSVRHPDQPITLRPHHAIAIIRQSMSTGLDFSFTGDLRKIAGKFSAGDAVSNNFFLFFRGPLTPTSGNENPLSRISTQGKCNEMMKRIEGHNHLVPWGSQGIPRVNIAPFPWMAPALSKYAQQIHITQLPTPLKLVI